MGPDELRCEEEDCDFIAKTKAKLKEHSLSHSKEKQTCGECGKDFAGLRSLRVHEGRIHKKKDVESTESAENPQVEEGLGVEDISDQLPVVPASSEKVRVNNAKAKIKVKDATAKPSTPRLKKGKRKSAKLLIQDINGKTKTEISVTSPDQEAESKEETLLTEKVEEWCVPCHCPQCQPCSNVCCDNTPVRAGLCCDPRTLGRCLQPYEPQCFAPCCHPSVFLPDHYRYIDGRLEVSQPCLLASPHFTLLAEEDRQEAECLIYQDSLSEATQLQLTLSYFAPAGTLSTDEEEEEENGLLSDLPPPTPVVTARSPKSRRSSQTREYTYRFPGGSSLLSGCRIVHAFRNNKPAVCYRSSCGQNFRSKDKLISFMKSKYPEKVEEDYPVISEKTISTTIKPKVSSGDINKDIGREPESRLDSVVSNLSSKIPQCSINPVKPEPVYLSCPVCKEEIPKNIFTKHFLTHPNPGANAKSLQGSSPTVNKDKVAEEKKSSAPGKVSKHVQDDVQKENDEIVDQKLKLKQKVTHKEEEAGKEVSSDFLNVTCPLPVVSSPSEKVKKTGVRQKRSRSISTIEKPQVPKKVRKGNVGENPGGSQANTGIERKEPVKRGRKKKTE